MIEDPILRCRLVHLARLFDKPPAFVLPVFFEIGTDGPHLIQALSGEGTIDAFVPVDLTGISVHPAVGEVWYREVGEAPVLAFEYLDGHFAIDERSGLVENLKSALEMPELRERPFLRSVVAEFCGNKEVAKRAEIDWLSMLNGAPRTQSYYRANVLARDIINNALRADGRGPWRRRFRLVETENSLRVELPNDAGKEEVERMREVVHQCKADLAALSKESAWECSVASPPRAFVRHGAMVRGAVAVADGTRALTWSDDYTLRLWNLQSGASRTFEGHSGRVLGVVVLADGARALSWSSDCTLRLWHLESGDSRAFRGHGNGVLGAVVSADETHALSWSEDDTLRVWDLKSGESRVLEGHGEQVRGALALADGSQALSWSYLTLRLWDLESGAGRALEGHSDGALSAVVSADGQRALSWSDADDETLRVWDLSSGAGRVLDRGELSGAVISADGRRALSWTHLTLSLWNLETGTGRVLDRSAVSDAMMLADGARALSWSEDHKLRLWDLSSGESRALEGHSDRVLGVVLADGARALSWSEDRTLRLWDLSALEELACFVCDNPLTCCAVSANRQLAIAGDSRGRVLFFDLPA